MLCQFSFENYKSYKSETTFDFQATSIPEFSDSLLTSDKGRVTGILDGRKTTKEEIGLYMTDSAAVGEEAKV